MEQKIAKVQDLLKKENIDGWLLYDFQKRNPLALEFLQIASSSHLTRRFFYWIPASGVPVKIVHEIESHVLAALPGKALSYFTWQMLEAHLQSLLKGKKRVAMEYSPRNAIPSISLVDAGTVELIREMVEEVVSSSVLIQPFTSVLTSLQRQSHLEAAEVLDHVAGYTWEFIAEQIRKDEKITEYDVQKFMVLEMDKAGCLFEGRPICAVNANSSNPHYCPTKENHQLIQRGDFVLIDLWCKKKTEGSVYADISRVAVVDSKCNKKQQTIFSLVKKAQEAATDLVTDRCSKGIEVRGSEVDMAARLVIEEAGYGKYFIHRTGHNIYTQAHGPGAHLDSLETYDERVLLPGTCFSIEPGVYIPGEFGVRLEYDVYIGLDLSVTVTGGVQEEIRRLL